MVVPHPEFLHRAILECTLVIENELFPVIVCKPGESNDCHGIMPPSRKMLGNKRLLQPFVPSSLDILSNRRPAKLTLYDPLRYGVLSSDDRYSVFVLPQERAYSTTLCAIMQSPSEIMREQNNLAPTTLVQSQR
jgi:hypothetical protein